LTGGHRWAERYDRELRNVFAVQDEVTRTIVAILATHVNKAEAERTLLKPAATCEAYDYYLRGVAAYHSHATEPRTMPISEARRLLEKSLSIDHNYARAYAMLSRTRVRTFWDPVDRDHLDPAGIDRAYELARKAVQLDPNLPIAHFQLGMALLFKHRRDEAVAEFDRALALNPNYTEYQFGFGLLLAGQTARAIEALQANVRLDPFGFPTRHLFMGQAYYMLERYAQALPHLRESASRLPDQWANYAFLAATHAQLGQFAEARLAVIQLLRTNPDITIERTMRSLPYNEMRDVEHLSGGLRKAGLSLRVSTAEADHDGSADGRSELAVLSLQPRNAHPGAPSPAPHQPDRGADIGGVSAEAATFLQRDRRPSIDPELMIRMLIVGYCHGIRFERRLIFLSSAASPLHGRC